MPASPTAAQSAASRLNGARSKGPATPEGKQRAARNGTRHGLCGKTFYLLADEDPDEFARHAADWHRDLAPRDTSECEAVETVLRAAWREHRADRLEVSVLDAIFAVDGIDDPAEAMAVRIRAMRGLSTLLRYRAQIGREFAQSLSRLEELRRRRPGALEQMRDEPERAACAAVRNEPNASAATPAPVVRNEPNAPATAAVRSEPKSATTAAPVRNEPNAAAASPTFTVRSEPEPTRKLNRHQRRAFAARARQRAG